ncbi:MAG: tetratricopeptide repeat protein [Anaerolineae bacterium]|nr:tetratricopeptide repeat protein [Anaerolineae bacterium]
MNKRNLFFLPVLLLLCLTALPTLAQDQPELNCPAFADSPTDVRVSYYMGEGAAFFAASQLTRATNSFSCIIEQIDSSYVSAYLSRAIVYTQRRDYELALADYNSAINRDSSSVAAYNNRGIVYAAMQDYERALADFNQVLTLDSNNTTGYINRGVIYALQSSFDEAIADLESAIDISNIENVIDTLLDPDRPSDAPRPEYDTDDAQAYAILGIIYSARSLANYQDYLLLTGASADQRIQSAAGALQSRFNFELRLDDGTWLLAADFTPGDQ